MEYVQDITLDVNSNNAYTTIGAKQGDNGSRIINVHLTEDGIPMDLQQGWSAYFRFRKPDGKAVINDCELDPTNDIIKMTLTAQTLASAGRGYGDITIQEGSRILSSVSFIIIIMASPSVANEATSSNEFGFLNAVVNDASHTIYEAQAWAEGKRGSTEVYGEGDDFSETSTYTEGDYVWYDGQLYQFLTDHAPGEWNSEEVDAIVGFFSFSYQSNAITGVNWIVTPDGQTTFFNEFKYSPGQHRIFNFTYTGNNDLWQLIITTYDGDAKSESEPIINTLETYGLVPTIMSGAHLAKNDTITVDLREPDHAYHNNAKYYANQAREHKNAILNLTVDAETVADLEHGGRAEVEKTIIDGVDHLHFKIPKGDTGDVNFLTFDIDYNNGQLIMYRPDHIAPQVDFYIDNTGQLCVRIYSNVSENNGGGN